MVVSDYNSTPTDANFAHISINPDVASLVRSGLDRSMNWVSCVGGTELEGEGQGGKKMGDGQMSLSLVAHHT